MANIHLSEQLAALRQLFDDRRKIITDTDSRLDVDLERIRISIQGLEDQERQILDDRRKNIQAEQELADGLLQAELGLILDRLADSQAQIQSAEAYWSSLRELQAQRQQLFLDVPALENNWKDYQTFSSLNESELQAMPAYYRHSLQAAHEELKGRIEPVLEIDEKERQLAYPEGILIQIVVALDASGEQVYGILPLPAEQPANSTGITALDQVARAILAAIGKLAEQPEWFIAEPERDAWAGYFVLSMLAEPPDDGRSIAELLSEQLRLELRAQPQFQRIVPDVQSVEMPWNVWLQGKAIIPIQKAEPEFSHPEPTVTTPEVDLSHTIYTPQDIRSWERPLKVGEESSWTIKARRLRTMLIRLAARGYVGGQGLTEAGLWEGLPPVHQQPVREAITQLLDIGLLLNQADDSNTSRVITVSHDHLGEIQNLINRDITPFWLPLVGTE